MNYRDGRFLKVDGISYHEMGESVYLTVTRTPMAVTITGTVNQGASEPNGLTFQACIDPENRVVEVSEGIRMGGTAASFLKACTATQEHMEHLSDELTEFQDSERHFIYTIEKECKEGFDPNFILLLLAMRPIGMSKGGLKRILKTISEGTLKDKPNDQTLKDHLVQSFHQWRYYVVANAMIEAGLGGSQEEIEDKLLGLNQKLSVVSG